jgi:hypothetical protein
LLGKDWVEDHLAQAAAPDNKSVWQTLRTNTRKRGGAQDLGGWRYEHLQVLLLNEDARE